MAITRKNRSLKKKKSKALKKSRSKRSLKKKKSTKSRKMKGGSLIPCGEKPGLLTRKQTIDVAWNAGNITTDVLMKALLVICVTFKRFVNNTEELVEFESNDVLYAFNSSLEKESVKPDYEYVLRILTDKFNLNSDIINVNMCQLMKALYYAAMYIQSKNDKQIPEFTFQNKSDWKKIYNKYKTVFETDPKTSKHFASIVPDLKIPDRYAEVTHKALEQVLGDSGLPQNETIEAEKTTKVNFKDAVAANEDKVNLNDTASVEHMSFRAAEIRTQQEQQQEEKEFGTHGYTYEGPQDNQLANKF